MNGWANYATWNFMLWYGDQLDEYAEDFAAYFVVASTQEVVDDLHAWAWDVVGLSEIPLGFARDAASNAFTDISWTQISDRVQAIAQAHLTKIED